ncbi:hypothetical protein DUNSADRAFT_13056 [Dunaliella salina]|uniref:PAS domain-containing protein n=1 Tax=Dunaliella salina TaxID=3046 RepID=A0ABQ7H3K2_DUNSA|nr:hypothetical protein DUNSADRAFT_13056 [Dunaliella salina]|eukprot:KAF5841393.1 hypothetical protein DUNSADRAFT_13056 [Dunaliella salina]
MPSQMPCNRHAVHLTFIDARRVYAAYKVFVPVFATGSCTPPSFLDLCSCSSRSLAWTVQRPPQVSGVGSDSVFMGAMQVATAPPNVIRVWCMPTGAVVSVDDSFQESFGKTYKDVAGRPFQSLTRDPDVILKLLDRAAGTREADFAEGKVQQKGVFVLHNYMDPVEVDIQVGMGGSESQRMLCFDMRLTHSQGMLMVVDARGRLLYMNSEMRRMLGISDDTNVSKLDMTSLMPPPFSLLHGKWMREAGAKVPKQSCRSGATVVMSGANKAPLPIRPKITTREVDESVQHLVRVEMSSWERGMDERQLVLTLDTHGNIIATNKALTSLFGFRMEELIGKSVACIVDVLAQLRDELEGTCVLDRKCCRVTPAA